MNVRQTLKRKVEEYPVVIVEFLYKNEFIIYDFKESKKTVFLNGMKSLENPISKTKGIMELEDLAYMAYTNFYYKK